MWRLTSSLTFLDLSECGDDVMKMMQWWNISRPHVRLNIYSTHCVQKKKSTENESIVVHTNWNWQKPASLRRSHFDDVSKTKQHREELQETLHSYSPAETSYDCFHRKHFTGDPHHTTCVWGSQVWIRTDYLHDCHMTHTCSCRWGRHVRWLVSVSPLKLNTIKTPIRFLSSLAHMCLSSEARFRGLQHPLVAVLVGIVVGRQRGSVHAWVVEGAVALVPAAALHHKVSTHRPLGHVWKRTGQEVGQTGSRSSSVHRYRDPCSH